MLRIVLAAALSTALAAPALAGDRAHSPLQISDALKAGCTVQHVHTPAGKTVHSPAIVTCRKAAPVETASRGDAPRPAQRTGVE